MWTCDIQMTKDVVQQSVSSAAGGEYKVSPSERSIFWWLSVQIEFVSFGLLTGLERKRSSGDT